MALRCNSQLQGVDNSCIETWKTSPEHKGQNDSKRAHTKLHVECSHQYTGDSILPQTRRAART